MINPVQILTAVFPFIFGLIAIALIPSKEKILNGQIKTYGADRLIAVYLIAFVFILVLGAYYIMSLFGDGSEEQIVNVFNGIFLITIAIGIMAVNSRNYTLFSKLDADGGTGLEAQIARPNLSSEGVLEVTPVEPKEVVDDKTKYRKRTVEPEMVECPRCGNAIKILVTERPLKISCPHCGTEGIIQ